MLIISSFPPAMTTGVSGWVKKFIPGSLTDFT